MSIGDSGTDCSGRQCGYAAFATELGEPELGCTDGGNYFYAQLLRAYESHFHDAALIKATSEINGVLNSIPEDENGRRLAFLHTPYGTMLAWIRHDLEIPKDAVRGDSPKEDHKRALGLIDPPPRESPEQGA